MKFHRTKPLHLTAVTAAVALAAAGLVGLTAPASAATPDKPGLNGDSLSSSPEKLGARAGKDGVCDTGELCLYYWQNREGAMLDLYLSEADFSGDILRGGGLGNGGSADNNTRSYLSRDIYYWRVYDGVNYTGTQIQCIAPGEAGNFDNSFWDQASSATFSSTPC